MGESIQGLNTQPHEHFVLWTRLLVRPSSGMSASIFVTQTCLSLLDHRAPATVATASITVQEARAQYCLCLNGNNPSAIHLMAISVCLASRRSIDCRFAKLVSLTEALSIGFCFGNMCYLGCVNGIQPYVSLTSLSPHPVWRGLAAPVPCSLPLDLHAHETASASWLP